MSCLKWEVASYVKATRTDGAHTVTTYWELWTVGLDQTAWYNMPCASIRKIKDKQWELTMPDINNDAHYFTTLKAAKAMGIVLVRMEN